MDNNQFAPRVTHKAGDADGCAGNWQCSSCKVAIPELPFKPRENSDPSKNTLLCRDCFKTKKAPR